MTWNYRIVRSVEPDGTEVFAIHEVHYDEAGTPESVTENPARPVGETLVELRGAFELYQRAFSRPVLEMAYFETLSRRPTIKTFRGEGGGFVWTHCPGCGPDVSIDEDGCCASCGAEAVHYADTREQAERRLALASALPEAKP